MYVLSLSEVMTLSGTRCTPAESGSVVRRAWSSGSDWQRRIAALRASQYTLVLRACAIATSLIVSEDNDSGELCKYLSRCVLCRLNMSCVVEVRFPLAKHFYEKNIPDNNQYLPVFLL
jgi:hypothetical protein